jgi:ATP-dependent DNA helicase RecG
VSALGLDSPVADIGRGVAHRRTGGRTKGPPAHEVLAESLGIRTVGQLLHHYPRRYIDRSATVPIRAVLRAAARSPQASLTPADAEVPTIRLGSEVTVIASVASVASRRTRRGQSMVTVVVGDPTGRLELPFFNQPWVARTYRQGMEVAVSGRVETFRGKPQLANHLIEILSGDEGEKVHTGRITPVHAVAEGITTRTLRELAFGALQRLGPIPDPLPATVLEGEGLAPEDEALRAIHFPADQEALDRARGRLKFDELFALELGVAYRKRRVERSAKAVTHDAEGELAGGLVDGLPFEPTGAQRRAMKEIAEDMTSGRPMNRLLQGDVGSGKTAVALYAAMIAVQSGHQATIMAPTEVLAAQHLRTVRALLAPVGGRNVLSLPRVAPGGQQSLLEPDVSSDPARGTAVTFAFLTSAVAGKDRLRVLDGIRDGSIDLLIGTHALVQEGVDFADLSLAVIDEQHRFGVHQRIQLKEKGAHSDVLIMTATPIPRTLALTYYGDLDVSVLDEMPGGRQPVGTTIARTAEERSSAYGLVREQVTAGRQAFVVCAAIDEGNRLDVRAAEQEAERLATKVFPDLRIGLLHGRMRSADKEAVMDRFREGEFDLLISTTVIEVGVDVPNATVMLVENAERFGLAQLHQLRGRIGRGGHRSFCVLFDESGPDNQEARARLAAMARTTDGFELAEEDLRLRGEGTLFDIRQSGMPDLKLARLSEDTDLVRRARTRAFAVIDSDPELSGHPELLDLLRAAFSGDAIDWLFHG